MTPAISASRISYVPDYDEYRLRAKRRQAEEDIPTSLPNGLPEQLHSPLVWSGKDFSDPSSWTYYLSTSDIEEVTHALRHFQSLNLSKGCISQATFPLPAVGPALRRLSKELHSGRGFFVIRGLPIDKYTANETVLLYTGISSYIGSLRGRQDSQYNGQQADVVLSHVVDLNAVVGRPAIGSPAFTADAQGFHTDTGDIVGLLMIGEGAEGGESCLASTGKIYNELAASRPDLIRTLASEWAIDGFKRSSTPYYLRALLYYTPATPKAPERILQFSRRSFTGYAGYKRSEYMPPLSEAQAEALDALHFTARSNDLTMDLKKGNMQFINNLALVHGRGAFRDELGNRDEELGWEVPGPLKGVWEGVYGGMKGKEECQVFPAAPVVGGAQYAL
ncbi:TauD/TfdA family dioxygenase [Aspergillus stella-maris]|uniref:TauD/TfdA family dioxygenase n=1 Tax=Aspergillus stella-maris TaxID=1810926 RepID=UPI003CCDCA6E